MGFLSRSSRILEWPTEGRNWVGRPYTSAHPRLLTPKYLFKGVPIAWECSECLKLFSITVDELLASEMREAPDHVQSEFRQHFCTVHLLSKVLE
jgi:hypothetical protein